MPEKLKAQVVAVLVMTPESSPLSIPQEQVTVDWGGFVGDKHAGRTMKAGVHSSLYPRGAEIRNTRQVSIVSTEELAAIAESLNLPHITPGWVGAYILLSGVPNLSSLPPSTRLLFSGGVALVIEDPITPCHSAAKGLQHQFPQQPRLAQLFPKAALGRRGVVGWVERPGRLTNGETVAIVVVGNEVE